MRSSPFPDDKPVKLHVETGRDLAEVFLINHEFALVSRGVGDLDVEVEPGVYKVKAHFGETTTEQLVVLNSDQTVDLSDQLPIASPVPLAESGPAPELDAELAASARVDLSAGSGAAIFLLSRRNAAADSDSDEPTLSGLSLHTLDGATVLDLDQGGSPASSRERATAATVEVDPGAYILRRSEDSGIVAEQSLLAVEGWQTQAFLLETEHDPDLGAQHEVSVLMSQQDFDPSDPMPAIVEEARAALAEERKVATEFINQSLFAKFENPMLGLFGAHLMLVAAEAMRETAAGEIHQPEASTRPSAPVEFDQTLFDGVVSNLSDLLGEDHPDVVALSTKAARSSRPPRPVTDPPMLWRSWQLLIEASNDAPDLVPASVWRLTLGALPTRPFFVWSPPQDRSGTTREWERQIADVLESSAPEDEVETSGIVTARSSSGAEEMRRRFSREMLAPRAVINELVEERRPELRA